MSQYKSNEFVASDSSDSEEEPPKLSPVKAKKEKKKDKNKEKAKEKLKEKSSKVKKEKRKRELSPPSPPPVFDEPAKKKERPKQKAPPEKKKREAAAKDPENATADLSDMKNIGLNRYIGIMEFKGKRYLNIREYYQASDGMRPTKKGITLVRDQWNLLKDSFFDIDEKIHMAGEEDYAPIELGKNKVVRVTKFKGRYLLIDIREMYMKEGESVPGKKGIALKPEQYGKIKEFCDEIDTMW